MYLCRFSLDRRFDCRPPSCRLIPCLLFSLDRVLVVVRLGFRSEQAHFLRTLIILCHIFAYVCTTDPCAAVTYVHPSYARNVSTLSEMAEKMDSSSVQPCAREISCA